VFGTWQLEFDKSERFTKGRQKAFHQREFIWHEVANTWPVTVVMLFDLIGEVENVLVKTRYQPAAVQMAASRAKADLAIGELIDCGFIPEPTGRFLQLTPIVFLR